MQARTQTFISREKCGYIGGAVIHLLPGTPSNTGYLGYSKIIGPIRGLKCNFVNMLIHV